MNAFHRQGVHLLFTPGCSTATCRWRWTLLSDMVTSSLITPKDVDAERKRRPRRDRDERGRPGRYRARGVQRAAVRRQRRSAGRSSAPSTRSTRSTREQIFEHYQAGALPPRSTWSSRRRANPRPRRGGLSLVQSAFGDALASDAQPALPRLNGAPYQADGALGDQAGVSVRSSRAQPDARLRRALAPHRQQAVRAGACSTRRSAAAMSSRLFQEVREKRGLAYSVYSFLRTARRHRHVGHLRGLPAVQGRRGAGRSAARRSPASSRGGLTDAELGPGQGPGPRLDRARPGGSVVPDEPPRQIRAGLPHAGAGRRSPGPDRGGQPRRTVPRRGRRGSWAARRHWPS